MDVAVQPPRIVRIIPRAFRDLMRPKRYKIFYGGRGSGKTWTLCDAIISLCYTIAPTKERQGLPFRVLCGREYQTSIADSVHFELVSSIQRLGLSPFFKVTERVIRCYLTGAVILFRGVHHNVDQIKSLGGIDLFWGEEAHSMTQDSLLYLDPTIRRDPPFGPFGKGSELWFSFNQHEETDPIYARFKCDRGAWEDEDTLVRPVTWKDNQFFPQVLERQRAAMEKDDDLGAYEWVWGTSCRRLGSSIIFKGKYVVEDFQTPHGADAPRFFFGADWGFANDPTALIRCWMKDEELYIDQEAYAVGVEIDEIPALFAGDAPNGEWENPNRRRGVPGALQWPIKADSSRPETISYVRRRGFQIAPAEKWDGCVEDGIAHLKGFKKLHIHQRCKNTAQEARLYSYKVDKQTKEVLPLVVDKHNHAWDAVRYSLDGYIQRRGGLTIWERLADRLG